MATLSNMGPRGTSRPFAKPRARRALLLGAALAAVCAYGGYAWWRGEQQQQWAVASLPATPDLQRWPAEFRHRLEAAYQRVRTGQDPLEALGEASRLLHANGFLAEAAHVYAGLAHLDPGEPRWLHRHATILAGYGQTEEATALWNRVIDLQPDYVAAQLRLADLLLKGNELERAAELYGRILQREPEQAYAQLGLARVDYDAGRWEQARQRLEPLVQRTNYQLGYDLIVPVYERLGLADRAAAVRGQMLASGAYRDFPDPWVDELFNDSYDLYQLSLTAGVAERGGDPDTAIRRLERALRLEPANHSLHYQLGLTYQTKRDLAKARHHLEQCTRLEPTFSDAWSHLSHLLGRQRDAAAASRVLAEGLRHNPQSHGLRLMRARQWKEAGRVEEAIRDYVAAIALRPNAADPYVELALVQLRAGAVEDGVAQLEKALIAEPEHPTALATLALHAVEAGDRAAAERWLARCREQPRLPRAHLQMIEEQYRQRFAR